MNHRSRLGFDCGVETTIRDGNTFSLSGPLTPPNGDAVLRGVTVLPSPTMIGNLGGAIKPRNS